MNDLTITPQHNKKSILDMSKDRNFFKKAFRRNQRRNHDCDKWSFIKQDIKGEWERKMICGIMLKWGQPLYPVNY